MSAAKEHKYIYGLEILEFVDDNNNNSWSSNKHNNGMWIWDLTN